MNKKSKAQKYLILICTILAFMSGCTGANNPLLDPSPGIVDGKVLDLNNTPVKQAAVRLENTLVSSESVLSDASGNYSIAEVNPGVYDLVAEKTISGIKYLARRRFLSIDAATRIQREVQIRPSGRIRGKVMLEGFDSHAGVKVSLIGTGKSMLTQADGVYEFADLAYTYRDEATNSLYLYDLVFTYSGYENQTVQDISLEAGGLTVVNDVELQNLDPIGEANVTGIVQLEARNGARNSVIKILGTAIEPFEILSDGVDQGGFNFSKVPVGSYILEVSNPDYYSTEIPFTIEAGQSELNVGTINLTNVQHFAEDRLAIDMTISPGGHQIAYAKYAPDNNAEHREIYIMDIAGVAYNSRISSRARVAEDRGMSWSNDGRQLLYVEKNEANIARLYRLNLISSSGGLITPLTSYSLDVSQPAFAPVGYRFVYQYFETTGSIFGAELVQRASGWKIENQVTVIPERNDQISQNQFSSIEFGISDRILYSKDGDGGFTVPFAANGDLTLRFPINDMISDSHSVTYSPNNDHISYAISDSASNGIYIANIDGSSAERVSLHIGRSLEYSSDGKHLYFIDQSPSKQRRLARMIVPSKWYSENY